MDECHEFYFLHLPRLISYVVPVLQSRKGRVEIGSGVLVNAKGRHFVATAKHCIDADVRVLLGPNSLKPDETGRPRQLRVINRGWHDTLDLGYLEIEEPVCAELSWDQLAYDRIIDGSAQIIGYPKVLVEVNQTTPGKLTDISLAAGTFGTTLRESNDDRMIFNYPRIGRKYEKMTGAWFESPFPETPEGFSGGACFGVTKSSGLITHVEYKLLAIQYAWNQRDCVFAIPIRRWCELLAERGVV